MTTSGLKEQSGIRIAAKGTGVNIVMGDKRIAGSLSLPCRWTESLRGNLGFDLAALLARDYEAVVLMPPVLV